MALREVPCHGPGSFVLRDYNHAAKDFWSFNSVRRPTLDDSQAKLDVYSDDTDSYNDLNQ